jgi:hypothetical protein
VQSVEWPAEGKLLLPGLGSKVKSVSNARWRSRIEIRKTANGVVVDLPPQAPDANASVIKMEIAGKPKVVALFIKPAADGSIVLPASLVDFGISKKGSAPSLKQSKEGAEISSWNTPEAPVSWSFSGLKPGNYEVIWPKSPDSKPPRPLLSLARRLRF